MISIFSRKKELRVKETILRGVYEENLRIVGKGPATVYQQSSSTIRKLFFSLLVLMIVFFVQWNPLADPFSPEGQLTASPLARKPLLRTVAESVKPSEYEAFTVNPIMPLSRMFGLDVKTIMIDPGHGGADNGTTGKMGTREKDITLDIARRLRDRLTKYGRYTVLMTRDQDVTVPLNKRVALALSSRADLFISIHVNYLPTKPINIIETYYFGPSSDVKTLKLAEQENVGSQYGLSDFKKIIEKIGETLKLQESQKLAAIIQKNLFVNINRENGNSYNFGVKRAPFVVLLGVDIPAVLAEVSCLSNKEEERKLNTESHRENIAHYLEAGILDYLNKGEADYAANRRAER
jgi:N-acetylmuramoyl-L-alanine amidase